MSAHVSLNLPKELGVSDTIRGLPNILLLVFNELNNFNYIGAQVLFSIYHMTSKLIQNHIFRVKTSSVCHL